MISPKRRWEILLAGAPGAGKSTLCRALLGGSEDVAKTQGPEFYGDTIVDVPGEYVTVSRFRMAFLAMAQDVRMILYLQAADEEQAQIPPGLLQTPPGVTVAGVVTKIDSPGANIERSEQFLEYLGISKPYFHICALNADSLADLKEWLQQNAAGTPSGN